MSKKYVPTFLRKSEQDKELVNTSLPAKEATPLAPATLASLTSSNAPVETTSFRSLRATRMSSSIAPAPVLSSDDFPTLSAAPSKVKTATAPAPTAWKASFASLAGKWAQEQKEQEEKERSEASSRRFMEEEERRKKYEFQQGLKALGAVNVTSYYQNKPAIYQSEEDIQREKERSRHVAELLAEDAKYNGMVYEDDTEQSAEDWEWRRRSKHEF